MGLLPLHDSKYVLDGLFDNINEGIHKDKSVQQALFWNDPAGCVRYDQSNINEVWKYTDPVGPYKMTFIILVFFKRIEHNVLDPSFYEIDLRVKRPDVDDFVLNLIVPLSPDKDWEPRIPPCNGKLKDSMNMLLQTQIQKSAYMTEFWGNVNRMVNTKFNNYALTPKTHRLVQTQYDQLKTD